MAVEKNAVYKVHNGVDFDTINFKTIASQVKTNGGSDVETQLADIPKKLSVINPTLVNGWVNSDTNNFFGLEVWKDVTGCVHIRGMIQPTVGGTDEAVPFWLPAGYIPKRKQVFLIKTGSDNINCFATIRTDGAVIISTPGTSAIYVNFGEIIFRAVD